MRSLSLAAFASVAAVAALVAAPAAHAQDMMMGGSYTRDMMLARNDSTGANSIAAIAMSDPQFSTLVKLVKKAGLDNSLMYRGPLTVFAPTNEAFDKLPKGTLKALMMPENIKFLQKILMYHIVPGGYNAADVGTLNGKMVPTTARMTQLSIQSGPSIGYSGLMTTSGDMKPGEMGVGPGTARVIRPDIMASNGIVHVIDTVLLPPLTDMEQKDLMMAVKSAKMSRMMDKDKDMSLATEAMKGQRSAPAQLMEKPLGGSATEPPVKQP